MAFQTQATGRDCHLFVRGRQINFQLKIDEPRICDVANGLRNRLRISGMRVTIFEGADFECLRQLDRITQSSWNK